MPCIEKEPKKDVYCIGRRQYQRYLNILFWGCLSGAVVTSMSGVVLGGVVEVVGSNLARGKIFTASTQMILGWPSTKIVQMVLVYCISRPQRLK